MWIEKYMSPLLENAGWESEENYLRDLLKIDGSAPMRGRMNERKNWGHAIPMMSSSDGTQYLLPPSQHVLVLGSTGSGKTRDVLAHGVLNGIATNASMLVLDVKGELYDMAAAAAERNGAMVCRMDLREMDKSCQFNPLHLAQHAIKNGNTVLAETLVGEIAASIFPDPPKNSTMDPFWARSSRSLFTGVALALLHLYPSRPCTIPAIRDELQKIDPNKTTCDLMEKVTHKLGNTSKAYGCLNPLFIASEKTAGNMLTSLFSDLEPYCANSQMERILSGNTIDLERIAAGRHQYVLFFEVDDSSAVSYGIAKMLISQLNHVLTEAANSAPNRTLVRPFMFMLDELGNAFAIPNFDRMLSMSRSRNITIVACLQSLTQLDEMYGPSIAETITSNMSAIMVLATFAPNTWRLVSQLCGVNVLGEPLVSTNDVARLQRGQCLVLRRGMRPFMTHLADVTTNPAL